LQEGKTFQFEGETKELILITLKNIFLTLITIGIYFPFAKTNTRRYFWNNVKFDNENFEYTGTGIEILKGYFLTGFVFISFQLATKLLAGVAPVAIAIITLFFFIFVVFFLAPFALYRSHAYLMSRTKLRGISFNASREGQKEYHKQFVIEVFRTAFTFGIAFPWSYVNLQRIKLKNTTYGNKSFKYYGEGSEVFLIYLKGFLLQGLTLGIYSFWMQAEMLRYQAGNSLFDGKSFKLELTGFEMFKLALFNIAVILLTLGIATPWVLVHNVCFYAEKLSFNGDINYDEITFVDQEKVSGFGMGVGESLDLDLGL